MPTLQRDYDVWFFARSNSIRNCRYSIGCFTRIATTIFQWWIQRKVRVGVLHGAWKYSSSKQSGGFQESKALRLQVSWYRRHDLLDPDECAIHMEELKCSQKRWGAAIDAEVHETTGCDNRLSENRWHCIRLFCWRVCIMNCVCKPCGVVHPILLHE